MRHRAWGTKIMTRPLRGTRYLSGSNTWLERHLTQAHASLDFAQTLAWYARHVPGLTERERALLACNDRYFLLSGPLGRADVLHPWLFARCREVEAAPDGHLDLWARYHGKSTIITFAGVIQELLCDPDLTVAIFSHTKPIAKAFLVQIKRELESNDCLKRLYPDVLWKEPAREAPKWSETEGIVLKRASNPKEASVEAHGLVDGQPTSRHYGLLVYDDVVTVESVGSPEQIKKTTDRWELSDNLGSTAGVRKWHCGTRYHFGDTYGIILERRVLKSRIHAATDDGTLTGAPVLLTPARWEEIKSAQRSTVSAQMLLDPRAGNVAVFQAEWFKNYEVRPRQLNVYILVDPAKGRGARSDRTAIAVIGIDVAGNKYLLDGVRHRMQFSERYQFIKQFHEFWSEYPGVQSCCVGYERYGAMVDIEVIAEWQARDKYWFPIEELNFPRDGTAHAKHDRVERLEPDLRRGRFLLPAVVHHPDFGGANGTATWKVWSEEDLGKAERGSLEASYKPGQIVYRPLAGLTRAQRVCEATAERFRIVKPIKRLDEDRNVYDLTRAFIEEALFFPFAPHDDLIDAASRIYDMTPCPPSRWERGEFVPTVHPDA